MSVSILTAGRRGGPARRHPNRCTIGVESMEGRALLASAAVTGAVYMVQQAQLDLHRQIDAEIATLENNRVSIEDAKNTFIYNNKSDIVALKQDELANPANAAADRAAIATDQKNIKNASRDYKFAVEQQSQEIRQLVKLGNQVDANTKSQTRALNRGTSDPNNIQTVITKYSTTVQTSITNIDTTATKNLNGLFDTFNGGTA